MPDDFQTQVMAFMQDISHRLGAIEDVLLVQKPEEPASPARSDGLYAFTRPAERNVAQYLDRQMTSADAWEAFERSLHGVNWRGGYIADVSYDEAWQEIEALKTGDQALITHYRSLDPEFAGYALLVGLVAPVKYDGSTFGVNAKTRESFAGYTIQSFLDAQFNAPANGAPGIG